MERKIFAFFALAMGAMGAMAAEPATFQKVGSAAESEQEFFPGEHRAPPVMGDTYYLTCSEFHFMGMVILESKDILLFSGQ